MTRKLFMVLLASMMACFLPVQVTAFERGDSTTDPVGGEVGYRPPPEGDQEIDLIEQKVTLIRQDIEILKNLLTDMTSRLQLLKDKTVVRPDLNFSGNMIDDTPEEENFTAKVVGLLGEPLPQEVPPQEGQVIFWDGTNWVLQTPPAYIVTGPKQ